LGGVKIKRLNFKKDNWNSFLHILLILYIYYIWK
jgi:hypothetical protein